jgi:DNA-binding NtrC family response regulator
LNSEPELGVDIGALSARLRFNPEDGCIWLEGERMMLMHLSAFASFRKELMETVGLETARGMLMRLGYASGAIDGALARRARPEEDLLANFLAGPRLHAIEGMVVVEPIAHTFDPLTNYHAGEWIWRNSAEVEAHLLENGLSLEPVCWSAVGYASGYSSVFMGRPILYKEVECRAKGDAQCRIVGKPVEEWEDTSGDDLNHEWSLAGDGDADHWGRIVDKPIHSPDQVEGSMVGASPSFVSMMQMISKVAPTEAPVLLVGEVGVGKKIAARAIHRFSTRSRQPFISFNCSSCSGDALDAELFGQEKGAPGGATISRGGRVERANRGTLFLEDVHCLDARAQAKLLRVLQTGEVDRAGGTQPRPVKVRIIASTTPRISVAVRDGSFREDLYYKLNTFPILLVPLREHRSDIPLLTKHFISVFADRHRKEIRGVSQSSVSFLLTYDFPGNVAELESMIERAVILVPSSGILDVSHLSSALDQRSPRFFSVSRNGSLVLGGVEASGTGTDQGTETLDRLLEGKFHLEGFENDIIVRAVERASGNLSKAARELGMTRPQLAYRIRKIREIGENFRETDIT